MAAQKEILSFYPDQSTLEALDHISAVMGCDQSELLNRAVSQFIETYEWQVNHIKTAQQQAVDGEFVPESEWRAAFNRQQPE